jgi:hypothetical protein
MPAFVALLLQGFIIVLTSTVGQWLFALGVGIVAYTGIGALLASVSSNVAASGAGLSSEMLGLFAMFKMNTALNIIVR